MHVSTVCENCFGDVPLAFSNVKQCVLKGTIVHVHRDDNFLPFSVQFFNENNNEA